CPKVCDVRVIQKAGPCVQQMTVLMRAESREVFHRLVWNTERRDKCPAFIENDSDQYIKLMRIQVADNTELSGAVCRGCSAPLDLVAKTVRIGGIVAFH